MTSFVPDLSFALLMRAELAANNFEEAAAVETADTINMAGGGPSCCVYEATAEARARGTAPPPNDRLADSHQAQGGLPGEQGAPPHVACRRFDAGGLRKGRSEARPFRREMRSQYGPPSKFQD